MQKWRHWEPASRQNGLAVALRELGRIEQTLFILSWLQGVELRRRVNVGLNKGEAKKRLGKSCLPLSAWRDKGPHLRAAALSRKRSHPRHGSIVLWNTVYIERAIRSPLQPQRT
jgi:TnpA family transposase